MSDESGSSTDKPSKGKFIRETETGMGAEVKMEELLLNKPTKKNGVYNQLHSIPMIIDEYPHQKDRMMAVCTDYLQKPCLIAFSTTASIMYNVIP